MGHPDNRLFPHVDPGGIAFLPLLDQFHEGVMVIDTQGVVLYMNAAQAKMDDFKPIEAVGRKVSDLYRVDEGTSPAMACISSGRAVRNLACYYRTHLGRVVNSIHNIYPLFSEADLIGAICFITNYKNDEQRYATIGKKQASKALPTYGVSPDTFTAQLRQNGTRYTFRDIIGADPDLLAAVKAAQMAAASPSPILLYGETGTGKELFAQSIHNQSPRAGNPYVAINCTAIPENLLEGMLFGTAKGAFTGAIHKAGLLEKANGGTLFLDEINAMSPSLQAKLLRFLQERKVRRVGAIRELDVDVKVISSTNLPPHSAIDAGDLRADLFYRLAVVYIHIPRLEDRKGDLEPLIAHFLRRTNARLGKEVSGISMAVMERFERYAWPGNVRELAHVIEGAMNVMGAQKTLRRRDLRMSLLGDAPPGASTARATAQPPSEADPIQAEGQMGQAPPGSSQTRPAKGTPLAELKQSHEISAIREALSASGGNAAQAARSLGISPQLLNYKLKRFGIDRKAFLPR